MMAQLPSIGSINERSRINFNDMQAEPAGFEKYNIEGTSKKIHTLKHFKGQDLELQYMEKKLKPEVEKEIKKGFFEIRKKFNRDDIAVRTANGEVITKTNEEEEEVQVYISHICLQSFHPIFSKLTVETVKLIL